MHEIFIILMVAAPLWVPAILVFLPPVVAKRLFILNAVVVLLAMVFSFTQASDHSRWQWASVFICMGAFWCLLAVGLGLVAVKLRNRFWPRAETTGHGDSPAATDALPETIVPGESDNPYRSPKT